MNDAKQTWANLTQAAKRLPPSGGTEAPYGFAGRVVARWLTGKEAEAPDLWLVLGGRFIVGTGLIMLAITAASAYDLESVWSTLTGVEPILDVFSSL